MATHLTVNLQTANTNEDFMETWSAQAPRGYSPERFMRRVSLYIPMANIQLIILKFNYSEKLY